MLKGAVWFLGTPTIVPAVAQLVIMWECPVPVLPLMVEEALIQLVGYPLHNPGCL